MDIAALRRQKVVIFGLPGAFTPTCSGSHVPGYLKNYDAFKAKASTIVCMAVNDGFVMGAWGRSQNVGDKIRMLGDGSAAFRKALGLELDLTAKGHGRALPALLAAGRQRRRQASQHRRRRPGQCSFAENMLAQLWLSAISQTCSSARASVRLFTAALPDNPPISGAEFHAQHPAADAPPISLPLTRRVALRVIPMPADANANGDIRRLDHVAGRPCGQQHSGAGRAKGRNRHRGGDIQFILSPAGYRSATW